MLKISFTNAEVSDHGYGLILLLLSQKMERIWRRLQCWIIIKMMCSVW